MPHTGPGVDYTTHETDKDGRYTTKSDRGREKDQATDSNGKLVESSHHGVCSRRSNADTPRRTVRDEDSSETRVDHANNDSVASLLGEVLGEVDARPVLCQEGADDENGDREKVVVIHG